MALWVGRLPGSRPPNQTLRQLRKRDIAKLSNFEPSTAHALARTVYARVEEPILSRELRSAALASGQALRSSTSGNHLSTPQFLVFFPNSGRAKSAKVGLSRPNAAQRPSDLARVGQHQAATQPKSANLDQIDPANFDE